MTNRRSLLKPERMVPVVWTPAEFILDDGSHMFISRDGSVRVAPPGCRPSLLIVDDPIGECAGRVGQRLNEDLKNDP